MRNLLLTLCFDGAAYHGWQIQPNALTVQEVLQNALYKVLQETPSLKGCSRTDAGVHARMFCVSFQTQRQIPCGRLLCAVNHFLPPDVAVTACREVPEAFHARFSCKGKQYVYQIWNAPVRSPFLRNRALHYWYPLDEAKLNAAAGYYVGAHDFTSFCTQDGRKMGSFVRTVTQAQVQREGDLVTFTVAADGFLYNMVRILTGTLLYVAQGKLAPQEIPKIFAARKRSFAGPTAPPQGLYLNRVDYEEAQLHA
ncbi:MULTISPECIES: tRNA pseudouridine(38-40) synthase TruA [Caproicibacterium]|uniref:tRNA pseudouridine synthase A n=1 Tax=Caproicibacterium argilliputei TaxID=3030016 RepID=A0AA97D6V8_9FIRM|nr:tRNA pseudouridine(38-40) synthase TruA [Caproicibacterium argilliputei]WOC31670.1 tRNA pseudouridine(38-40) synthase TruA [Caproicibacterium argilliputei]